jgi:hypothetical protein
MPFAHRSAFALCRFFGFAASLVGDLLRDREDE